MKVQTRPQKSCFHLWMRVNSKKNLLNSSPVNSTFHCNSISLNMKLQQISSPKWKILQPKGMSLMFLIMTFYDFFSVCVYHKKKLKMVLLSLVQLMHHRFFWTKTILRNIVEKNKLKKLQKISKNSVQTNLFVSFYNWT